MSERATECRHEALAFDPARDDGTRFADRLREDGASVVFDTIGELVRRLVTEARSNG
jgi:hypothetical protein